MKSVKPLFIVTGRSHIYICAQTSCIIRVSVKPEFNYSGLSRKISYGDEKHGTYCLTYEDNMGIAAPLKSAPMRFILTCAQTSGANANLSVRFISELMELLWNTAYSDKS